MTRRAEGLGRSAALARVRDIGTRITVFLCGGPFKLLGEELAVSACSRSVRTDIGRLQGRRIDGKVML